MRRSAPSCTTRTTTGIVGDPEHPRSRRHAHQGHEDHLRGERRGLRGAGVGYNQLRQVPTEALSAGEVGYVVAAVRSVKETRAGDTVFDADATRPPAAGLPGGALVRVRRRLSHRYQQYETLRDALEKLQLNDASLQYEPETSTALGFGFRCGFLGLLHLEIVQQRLEREFDLDLVTTVPSVEYHVFRTDGTEVLVENPALMPPRP